MQMQETKYESSGLHALDVIFEPGSKVIGIPAEVLNLEWMPTIIYNVENVVGDFLTPLGDSIMKIIVGGAGMLGLIAAKGKISAYDAAWLDNWFVQSLLGGFIPQGPTLTAALADARQLGAAMARGDTNTIIRALAKSPSEIQAEFNTLTSSLKNAFQLKGNASTYGTVDLQRQKEIPQFTVSSSTPAYAAESNGLQLGVRM